jgi:hypothetical protein
MNDSWCTARIAPAPTLRGTALRRRRRVGRHRRAGIVGQKVLGIGTVESRRRKPKVTEAAAQTTEVEPASEFDVEREDEPDDLEAPPRHQSEATIVSDTIHIPGVTVADTKRRKRKPAGEALPAQSLEPLETYLPPTTA